MKSQCGPIDRVYTGSANFREEQPCTNRRHPDFALHPFKIDSSSLQIINPEWRTMNTAKPKADKSSGPSETEGRKTLPPGQNK